METNALWTYKDLMRIFQRAYPTLYLWQRHEGLPAIMLNGRAVLFDPAEVLKWAKMAGKVVYYEEIPLRSSLVRQEALVQEVGDFLG